MSRAPRIHAAALALASALASSCGTPERTESRTPFEIGKEALQASDYRTAVAQLSLAIESAKGGPFPAEALLLRGEAHLAVAGKDPGRTGSESLGLALKDIEMVLGSAGEEAGVLRARAFAARGKALLAAGDEPGAEGALRETLRLEPERGALRLEAHRGLGWIQFRRAEAGMKPAATAKEERGTQESFREAQDQFSAGLQIDKDDLDSNLGKGMCLYYRGQDREAIAYLERAAELAERRAADPKGHYFLARAIESNKGFYEKALDHYRKAVLADPGRSFRPLYVHLMDVLLVYLSPSHAEFAWFLDAILDYQDEDPGYWRKAEDLAAKLAESSATPAKEQGLLARALARARNRTTEEAVADALRLQERGDFGALVSRIFPADPGRTDYLYGRALTLFAAKRHVELDAFFKDDVFRALDPEARRSVWFQRALVVEGRNIVARWLEESQRNGSLATTEAKLERDRRLGKARDAFQDYLDRYPRDHDVRMALGEVQELMESFPAAYVSYAFIAAGENGDHPPALQRILRLHKERLLPEKVEGEAWNLLRGYQGGDPAIEEYVTRTRSTIEADLKLYCGGCGRKGAQGDLMCLECGRRIGH